MTREQEHEKLYKELSTQVRRTNAMLQRLRGHFGDEPGWAATRLLNKLDIDVLNAVTEKGYIKYNKNLSNRQMKAILKATDTFLKSKTSTVKGVQENMAKIKAGIGESFEITSKEAGMLYEFFSSDDYRLTNEVKYELAKIAVEVHEKNGSFEDFVEIAESYIDLGNDEDMKALLRHVFDIFEDRTALRKFGEMEL